ncbi:type II toxin-antitoxin system Phd/YefM family antitoxin [Pseudomonas sp. NPDC086112]|uniref:type II toxin-antitoxin system Phd/YefM family antitoxin n=1 Tax=Pseudomonas sp. NPDC086112 TaxID=3364430 RepID=UPI00380B0064
MNRDIFSELVEDFDALAADRQGNVTLLPHRVKRSKLAPVPLEKSRSFTASKYSGYICPEYGREIMIVVPLAEAKNNLSKLVDDAAAGQIITIAKHGRALAQLVPVGKPCGQRIGAMKGKLVLPEDFDASLPDDMLDTFEGTQE